MKLSDYVANFLKEQNIRYVFQIIGGASVHMVNSLAEAKGIDYICFQHEQVGAMAADGYSRITKNIGAAMATSGPGMTNLITGIANAYFDSTPTIFLTGQVNRFESKQGRLVRQVGFQETDIVNIVKPLTKYSVQITDPLQIRYELEKCIAIAKSGRAGPVLIDIPMDVQRSEIDPKSLKGFDLKEIKIDIDSKAKIIKSIKSALAALLKAKRPVLIAGGGIRYADQTKIFEKLVSMLKIPVVATWSGIDVLPHDNPYYIEQIGVYGNRAGNFTVQNSDWMLSIGSRLDTRITGGKPETFARGAKKIVVDIDRQEIYKKRGFNPDIGICADVRDVIPLLISGLKNVKLPDISSWWKIVSEWKKKYPAVLPEWRKRKVKVDPYVFIETLSDLLPENSIIATDCGANLTWTIQAFKVKKGMRLFSPMGNSPMGNSLGEAIGACFANKRKSVICLTGDGGFQLNIQDLQTVVTYKLPIKIFIQNNHCYGIIKQFQDNYFNSRYEATTDSSGYKVPNFLKIARAYGIATETIKSHKELRRKIKKVLSHKGPIICDVIHPEEATLIPKLQFGKPIEDLSPLLPRDEFLKNMLIKPIS